MFFKEDETLKKIKRISLSLSLAFFSFLIALTFIYLIFPLTISLIILIVGSSFFIYFGYKITRLYKKYFNGVLKKDFISDKQFKIIEMFNFSYIVLIVVILPLLRILRLENTILKLVLLIWFPISTLIYAIMINPKLADKIK